MNEAEIKQKPSEISDKKHSDIYDSTISKCIEEIPRLIRDGINKYSDHKKDEKKFKIQMSNRALIIVGFILLAASLFTYFGKVDGQTYVFL